MLPAFSGKQANWFVLVLPNIMEVFQIQRIKVARKALQAIIPIF